MNARQIATKWLNMPLHVKLEVAHKLGAYRKHDHRLTDKELLRALVERTSSEAVANAITEHR